MAGPWEKYRDNAASGPWSRYQGVEFGRADSDGDVLATTEDGGRVVRDQSGGVSFTSQNYSTTDPDIIARLMEGATIKGEVRRGRDEQVLSERSGLVSTGAKALQGLPFVGEWLDEGLTAISPQAGANLRETQGAMERQRPKTSLAAEIAGGVVGSAPLAIVGAGAAMSGASRFSKVARGAALGAGAGAAEGAAQGAGRADPGRRVEGGAKGAGLGFGMGAALGAISPLVGEGVQALAKRVKKLDVRTIMDEFGVSAPAARRMRAALANDDLDTAAANLRRIGDDAMLADAGPATAQTLDDAMSSGGAALRIGRERVERRANEAGARLSGALDNILGPADGVKAAARDISQRTAAARQAAYSRAYAQPIDYAGPGRNIEDVLSRVPSDTLRGAIREANEAMQAAGVRNQQIMAQIADDGSVTFREMPNVQQLDEIKKALGSIGRESVDQFGRPTARGIRANKLAGELRDAISGAVPSYKAAVKMGGDKIAEDSALDIGRRLLGARTTFEEVRDAMKGASIEARAAAKRGLRENIEQTLSNVRRTITDPNTDAREAMQLVKDLSSRANQKKARLVLGTDAKALFDELEKAEAALSLRAAVSRNSATAIRQAGQAATKAEIQPGLLRRTLGKGGNPLDAAREVTETIAGIDPRSMSDAEQALMGEIADALTRIRGADAERALTVVNAAMKGQPIKDAEAALIGRAVAGAGWGSGYQVGQQSLAQ